MRMRKPVCPGDRKANNPEAEDIAIRPEDMEQAIQLGIVPEEVIEAGKSYMTHDPPVSGKLSAALLFLYFSGGRDRTMIWDTHQNARRLC